MSAAGEDGAGGAAVIRASVSPGEIRVAALDAEDALLEYRVERPARPEGIGDLHRARVSALAPAMGGAFLQLGGGATGFLPAAEIPGAALDVPVGKRLTQGQAIGVRVTRAAQGGKGPRVTARLTPEEAAAVLAAAASGTAAPALLRRGPEAALRLALAHPRAVVETDGAALAARLRAALGPARVRLLPPGRPAFDDAIEAEIETLAGPEVALPGGGRLLIHPTPALVAIDIDAGTAAGGRDHRAQAALNEAALAEAARQIRLRDLAGAIFLDVAGLAPRRRGALLAPLRAALAADPRAPRLIGLTGLGFAEIVRTRLHAPLHEVLGWPAPSPLSCGLAALRRLLREAADARRGGAPRWVLCAAPSVLAALRALPGALEEAEAALGRGTALELRANPGLSAGAEAIEEAGRDGG